MPFPSETIALPITKGLDVQTDARLVAPPALLEAENTQFSGGGAKKRRGHSAVLVRTESPVLHGVNDTTWVFGAGYGGVADAGASVLRGAGEEDTRFWVKENPEVGYLRGVASRDNETLVWDGFRLLSYLPSQADAQAPVFSEVSGSAVFPKLQASPLGKYAEAQETPEFADNGKIKVMAWVTGTAGSKDARYALFDSSTSALIAQGAFGVTDADYLRAFSLGDFLHIMVRDNGDGRAKLFSISAQDPNDITFRSFGDTTHFDIWKVDDSLALFAKTTVDGIHVTWISTTGSGSATHTTFDFSPATSAQTLISCAWDNEGDELGLFWYDGTGSLGFALLDGDGVLQKEDSFAATATRLTLSPKKVLNSANTALWDLFWDDGTNTYMKRGWRDPMIEFMQYGELYTRYRVLLASRAFRVGDRTFVWVGAPDTLQATWFLLDEALLPVGKMDFGVADVSGLGVSLHGINFKDGEDYDSLTPRFQLALNYKLRVVPPGADQATSGIYTEPTPKAVTLDFLPSLHAAQAGRTLYIPGAQLWAFDGQEIVEAGFHQGPTVTTAASDTGSLTLLGTYSYRVDLCHRNAQNEEVRSLSILTDSLELTGSQATITLTIPTVLTRREDSYFLIYRNAMEAGVPLVNWWLLNSRDPSDPTYLANDLTQDTLTYIDDGTVDDTEIQTREFHPASDTYLQPISAPACEVLASGRDRLWVAGGELPPGKVAPSRLFTPDEVPSFNSYLELQVDRSNEAVTALGFIGEVAVIFRKNSTYILDSDGPDNNAFGTWAPARLALADVGALSQASILRTSHGLMFQSPAGFRVVSAGGALTPLMEIDSVAKGFTVVGALLSEKEQEARWYGEDGTYVFNYLYGTWAHWSCSGVGVGKNAEGYALLARQDGHLWVETPGIYTDGDTTYTHRIRTSWLHGGNLGDFQRVRRIGGLGRYADTSTPDHNLRLEIFYDEREFWEERIEWSLPDFTTNQDTWGAATWGAGVWGDTTATVNNLEDFTWEWVRRPSRQKCSVFSVALEDVNTDGPGFILSAFTFELARKSGLNRTPERTGTGSYR